jgi:hypothetical protein
MPTAKRLVKQGKPAFPVGWTLSHSRRLDSFIPQLLAGLRPDKPVEDHGDTLQSGSITIFPDGWYRFSSGAHGPDAFSLLVELLGDEAGGFALEWLAGHPGMGAWEGIDTEAGREKARRLAERGAFLLQQSVPIQGTPSAAYLEERGISTLGDLDALLGHIVNARPERGEGAILGILTDVTTPQTVLGVQTLYLDPLGRPQTRPDGSKERRVFFIALDHSTRARACFRVPAIPISIPDDCPVLPGSEGAELIGQTIITEGLENALALSQACPFATVLGLPGIGRLKRFPVSGKVIVMRDNDGPDAPATKALIAGLDALQLAGAEVRETKTPLGRDAADYAAAGQFAELCQLLLDAKPATLSLEGELQRLANLDPLDYEVQRKAEAKRLGMRPAVLDREVAWRRSEDDDDSEREETLLAAQRAEAQYQAKAVGHIGDDDVWPEPVTDIAAVLEIALSQTGRYLRTAELRRVVGVLWGAHTHFVHHPLIVLDISPRLMFRAPTSRCGKTRGLQVIKLLTPRALMESLLTTSSFVETAHLLQPTLFIDECDKILKAKEKTELHAVLLASHERESASTSKMIPDEEQGHKLHFRKTWLTFAGTSKGDFPDDQFQNRCIFIDMARNSPQDRPTKFRKRRCAVLTECRQKIARWAADLTELPDVQMPVELPDFVADNWEPLFQIAALAGGRWPHLVREAALASYRLDVETAPSDRDMAFLIDLHTVMQGKQWMWCETIAAELCALDDPADNWKMARRGLPIDDQWVGFRLRHWIGKGQTERISVGTKRVRGIYTDKLRDVFSRYVSIFSGTSEKPSNSSSRPETDENIDLSEANSRTDTTTQTGHRPSGPSKRGNGVSSGRPDGVPKPSSAQPSSKPSLGKTETATGEFRSAGQLDELDGFLGVSANSESQKQVEMPRTATASPAGNKPRVASTRRAKAPPKPDRSGLPRTEETI